MINRNFIYFLLFYSVLKIWFACIMFSVTQQHNPKRKTLAYLIVTILMLLFTIDFIVIGIVLVYGFNYLTDRRVSSLIIAMALSFMGLCIKSSIGVTSYSIVFVVLIIELSKKNPLKTVSVFFAIGFSTLLIIGLVLFQNIELLFQYVIHVLKLSVSYSSALSLFPSNNWILLLLFFISILLPGFITRERNTRYLYFMLLPAAFAMWKHAISRQDYTHGMLMVVFLFLYWGIFILISRINVKTMFFLAALSISCFYANLENTWNFRPKKVEINGVVNFKTIMLNYKEFSLNFTSISNSNVKPNKLDSAILKLIGDSSIDSYPWELSYFAANKELNWKRRKTLQSGSFARWLDEINSEDFSREQGPQYIIFHYSKDSYGGMLGSIDGRYLLNDNPMTIKNILNYYTLKHKTGKYLLFQKNSFDNFMEEQNEPIAEKGWNDWIDVQPQADKILRIKLFASKNLIGAVRSFLYKSEIYLVDYMLTNGRVLTYRFIPGNAPDGIWVNPLVRNPQTPMIDQEVIKIRFRCTHSAFNKKDLSYQFEHLKLNSNGIENVNELFNQTERRMEEVFLTYVNDFDDKKNKAEHDLACSDKNSFSGDFSNLVQPGGFSHTFSLSLDTLWSQVNPSINELLLDTELNYLNPKSKASHVISIEDSNENAWKGIDLKKKSMQTWENSISISNLEREKHQSGILKVYVWNHGKHPLYIDDMRIVIKENLNKK